MQIFSKPIFEKPTFFFEFIERRDNAEGFGEGNFYGETGKDKIFFDAGKYRISGSSVKHDG